MTEAVRPDGMEGGVVSGAVVVKVKSPEVARLFDGSLDFTR